MYLIEAEAYAHGAAGDANSTLSGLVKSEILLSYCRMLEVFLRSYYCREE